MPPPPPRSSSSSPSGGRAVLGVDFGTESCRAGVFDAQTGKALGFRSEPYPTSFPRPSWAEQSPDDWWRALGVAVRGALRAASLPTTSSISAMCVDTTCCTVVAFDKKDHHPLRPAILWMDMRAAQQASRVLATGDPAVVVNGAGQGPVSAEWFLPKSLWIKENEPHVWNHPDCGVCEFQDWINLRLTGAYVASRNNVGVRWHWQAVAVDEASGGGGGKKNKGKGKKNDAKDPTPAQPPLTLLKALGLEDLRARWPGESVLELGARVGSGLTAEAAAHLGLKEGTIVAQGGADAFIGMLGLGVTKAGEMAMLTGSSHLHLGLSDRPLHAPGMFGCYSGALLPGLHVVEGGQTSTGSAVAWLKGKVLNAEVDAASNSGMVKEKGGAAAAVKKEEEEDDDDKATNKTKKRPRRPPAKAAAAAASSSSSSSSGLSYAQLDAQAALIQPGSDGLLALDHFQGNRTPHTDAKSRGAFVGLTLAHTPAHLHRALLEGVCFGTDAVLDAMKSAGFAPQRLFVAGGATRSPLWLQMHADVSGLPLSVPRGAGDAPALGCAILAAAAAGFHGGDVTKAAGAMVAVERTLEPDGAAAAAYAPVYRRWKALYPALKAIYHFDEEEVKQEEEAANAAAAGTSSAAPPPLVPPPPSTSAAAAAAANNTKKKPPPRPPIVIAPSLLAADLSNVTPDLACLGAYGGPPGHRWVHYDCFDGSLNTQITFGAPLLESLRPRADQRFDVHLIAHQPGQHLEALKKAGADAVTVQYENVVVADGGNSEQQQQQQQQQQQLTALLKRARQLGFPVVGLALALGTPAEAAVPFLPLVDRVLVMAVPLGYGGQKFQANEALAKIRALREMGGEGLSVGVDGGVGKAEAGLCTGAGADFIVAGSSVFKSGLGPAWAINELMDAAKAGAAAAPKKK